MSTLGPTKLCGMFTFGPKKVIAFEPCKLPVQQNSTGRSYQLSVSQQIQDSPKG